MTWLWWNMANKLATVAAAVGRTKSARLGCFWMADRGVELVTVRQSTLPTTAVRKPGSWLIPYTLRKARKRRWPTSWPLQKRSTDIRSVKKRPLMPTPSTYCFLRFLSATRLLSPSSCSLVRFCTSAHSCMTSCDNQGL